MKKMKKKTTTKTEIGEFSQYSIKWDERRVTFVLAADEVRFYGSWRKTLFGENGEGNSGTAYSIDVWAEVNGKPCSVESIHYIDKDPRAVPKSLNADICSCVNKWLYLTRQGKVDTLAGLQKKAEKPTLTIKRSATLDQILFKLKEFRDTCLTCGGFRAIILESDTPGDPRLTIQANFTTEAHALDGKIPKLFEADVIVSRSKDKKSGKSSQAALADNGSVQQLVESLKKTKDKTQQRKIRGMLRKLGYHGGLRNAKDQSAGEEQQGEQ